MPYSCYTGGKLSSQVEGAMRFIVAHQISSYIMIGAGGQQTDVAQPTWLRRFT